MTEKFNPLFPIGKTRLEAKEYLEKFNKEYYFRSCIEITNQTSVINSYNKGTHFYKIYDYKSENNDDDIILMFEGVQG